MAILICEVGQNGCGDMKLNKKLIKLAKQNGADAVKFQLYDTEALYPPDSPTKQQAKEAELSFWQAKELFLYGTLDQKIEVFFSVFDVEKVDWCEEIGVQRYKIAYSQNKNQKLWEAITATRKNIIISCLPPYHTPGTYPYEPEHWFSVEFLHCIPHYPTQITELQFPSQFINIGFSDHTIGLDAAKIALARGATIIERHFCLRHDLGVDAPWSMNPDELAELVRWKEVVRECL